MPTVWRSVHGLPLARCALRRLTPLRTAMSTGRVARTANLLRPTNGANRRAIPVTVTRHDCSVPRTGPNPRRRITHDSPARRHDQRIRKPNRCTLRLRCRARAVVVGSRMRNQRDRRNRPFQAVHDEVLPAVWQRPSRRLVGFQSRSAESPCCSNPRSTDRTAMST
jgi:hypothetical protein